MCEYCGKAQGHALLCPITSIERDQNRHDAFLRGVPVSTSDWVDSAAHAIARNLNPFQRDKLIEAFSLHHQWVERVMAAKYAAEMEGKSSDERA